MINEQTIIANKELFLQILRDSVKREGIDELIEYLKQSDFFIAPCSTKYHLNYRGGLCQHSLNVFTTLINLCTLYNISVVDNEETITIISLLHDICKSEFYKKELKPVKHGNNWVQEVVYVIDDQFPCGHGEKSVMRLLSFMKLTQEEMLAIRWHMGAWDNAVKGGDFSINSAMEKYKLVSLLQCADVISTYIVEK